MAMVIVIIIIIVIIIRLKLDEVERGNLNKFLNWLELHKTALHALVRIDMTWWCGFI